MLCVLLRPTNGGISRGILFTSEYIGVCSRNLGGNAEGIRSKQTIPYTIHLACCAGVMFSFHLDRLHDLFLSSQHCYQEHSHCK